MNTLKKWLLCLLFTGSALGLRAQQQQQEFGYTQYMDNLTPFNQAYSTMDKNGSINALVRKQFVGIPGAPSTFIFNCNFPIESVTGAAGLLVLNDQFAVEQNTQISAYFAKAIQTGDSQYLSASLSAGLKKYVANFSSLDPSDPQFRNDVRQTRPNLGFGIMYYSDSYYLGFSMPELNITGLGTASVQNAYNFRNHYYISGGLITVLSDDIKLKPAAMLSYARGVPFTANVSGTIYFKNMLGVGINYRTDNEAAGIMFINLNAFKLGYSYQFGTASNNLGGFNSSTQEISLTFRFGKNMQPKLL